MSILGPPVASDPSQAPTSCAICGVVQPLARMYLIKVIYSQPVVTGAFECPGDAHPGCTSEHAQQAAAACITEHLAPLLTTKAARSPDV